MSCAVLVVAHRYIHPTCEASLRELERRGYTVMRRFYIAPVDQARGHLAWQAVEQEGFDSTLWIDADIAFQPDAVDTLCRRNVPVVSGVYARKGLRSLAVATHPETDRITLGKNGGLMEAPHTGMGFTYVHGSVYRTVQKQHELPVCNKQSDLPLVPYFQPMITGESYLPEDAAFCERVRQCGYPVYADTTIRLGHIGDYEYTWEDAGNGKTLYDDYTFYISNEHARPANQG